MQPALASCFYQRMQEEVGRQHSEMDRPRHHHHHHHHHLIIYPLTARVVGAPQMISQPVFSIFPVLLCPLRPAELQACPLPDVVFPPLPLSASSSSPFHCTLQDGFGHTHTHTHTQRANYNTPSRAVEGMGVSILSVYRGLEVSWVCFDGG